MTCSMPLRACARVFAAAIALAVVISSCRSAPPDAQRAAPPPRPQAVAATQAETTRSAPAPATGASTSKSEASQWVELGPRIRANRSERAVEFDAVSVLKVGFLEQFVCLVGTREHESLFAFEGKASEMHAALLLAGFEPGRPGRWREVAGADGAPRIEGVPPEGAALAVAVVLPDGTTRPIDWFVRASPVASGVDRAPPSRFVFGGSRFVRTRNGGAERYVADSSGSLVGLVTFGDETIGCVDVIPDQAAVAEPVWEAWTERMPEPGTRVKIRVTAHALAAQSQQQSSPARGALGEAPR